VRPDEVTRRENERLARRELDLVLVGHLEPDLPALRLDSEVGPQVGEETEHAVARERAAGLFDRLHQVGSIRCHSSSKAASQ